MFSEGKLPSMKKITPFLWFDTQAEEAVQFYTTLIDNSRILDVNRYGPGAPMPEGTVMTINFILNGQEFAAINGGPYFRFTEAVSFVLHCETQQEVDTLWEKLSEGGEPGQCGWLKDRYGLSWQVVPVVLFSLLQDQDKEKVQRVTAAMLKMKKLDIAPLLQAANG